MKSWIDGNRVELPERCTGASAVDPFPELVVTMSAVVGQCSNAWLVPRMLGPRFESERRDPHGGPAPACRFVDKSKVKRYLEEQPEATCEALNSVLHFTHGPTHHRFVNEGAPEEGGERKESICSCRRHRELRAVHCDGSVTNQPPGTRPRPSPSLSFGSSEEPLVHTTDKRDDVRTAVAPSEALSRDIGGVRRCKTLAIVRQEIALVKVVTNAACLTGRLRGRALSRKWDIAANPQASPPNPPDVRTPRDPGHCARTTCDPHLVAWSSRSGTPLYRPRGRG
jgi:hypothetical protein